MTTLTRYPYDPTGELIQNFIPNELKQVNVANAIDAYLIVPNAAPYYGKSMSVVDNTGRTLDKGRDYFLTHRWQQACDATGLEVYGSITLSPSMAIGGYYLNYQTIGGENVDAKANTISDGLIALTSVLDGLPGDLDWSTIPAVFPPSRHNQHLDSINGLPQILTALNQMTSALSSAPAGVSIDDIKDIRSEFLNPLNINFSRLITAITASRNNPNLLLQLLEKVNTLYPVTTVDASATNYEVNIAGLFTLKIGQVQFLPDNPNGYATTYNKHLSFYGNAFNNKCIYANCEIASADQNAIYKDFIHLALPTRVGVDVLIDVDYMHLHDARIITSIALGF